MQNLDGALDQPISFFTSVLWPNGLQPARKVHEGWSQSVGQWSISFG